MGTHGRISFHTCLALLALAVLLSLACSNTTRELSEAVDPTKPSTEGALPTTAATTGPSGAETAQLAATSTAAPTEPEPVTITAQGFGQDGREVGFGFTLSNPNEGLAFESIQYQIAAYDQSGAVLETDSGYVDVLLPAQTLGVAGTMYVDEGATVSEVEVQLSGGEGVPSDPIPTFTIDSVAYRSGEISSAATGIIHSPYNRDVTDLRVAGIAYGDDGNIIGGGFTYANFVLANSTTGVEVPVTAAGDVSTVEIYASTSGLSRIAPSDRPSGSEALALAKQGFGQDGSECAYAMLIENPNQGYSVERTQYRVTVFSQDGTVLEVDEGHIEVLLPGQTLGASSEFYLDDGLLVDRMDVQIKAGDYVETEPIPAFTSDDVTYRPDAYFPKVTGHIVSPYAKDVTDLRVCAIAYDESGDIIGGGYTYLDFVPANGKAAVEVSVTVTEAPARVELYAALSALSDFQ